MFLIWCFRIEGESPWMCEMRDLWEGQEQEELVKVDMRDENGEEYEHGDRRQELVFIGVGLKHAPIQKTLDACLLTGKIVLECLSLDYKRQCTLPSLRDKSHGKSASSYFCKHLN